MSQVEISPDPFFWRPRFPGCTVLVIDGQIVSFLARRNTQDFSGVADAVGGAALASRTQGQLGCPLEWRAPESRLSG